MDFIAILLGRSISWISKTFNLGAGATWPGEIALRLSPDILSFLTKKISKGIIIVAGTNGKTTTSLMIRKILTDQGFTVLHNKSGANLLNGIVSSFFSDNKKMYDYAVFEVDENALPIIIGKLQISNSKQIRNSNFQTIVVLLNLFRDQLDRYGEVDAVAEKWLKTLKPFDNHTRILINADDPHLAFIGKNILANVSYFGLQDKMFYLPKMQHATDTIYCPSCGSRLIFDGVYFSHLGEWSCLKCKFTHPPVLLSSKEVKSPLEGVYNIYNTLAATLVAQTVDVPRQLIAKSLTDFTPAFGRMEQLIYKGKAIRILLSKNPTGFNESLRTVLASKEKGPLLLLLNDRIPDGTDVSWIWDVDFEVLGHDEHMMKKRDEHMMDERMIIISGDRYLDMAVRIKYAITNYELRKTEKTLQIEERLDEAVEEFVANIKSNETGWVLATYSAMLDVRKILTGKKIL